MWSLGSTNARQGHRSLSLRSGNSSRPLCFRIPRIPPGPPYAVASAEFKKDLEEVKTLGGDGKKTPSARTPDQTQIALFWWEASPIKWNRIARTVSADKGLSMRRRMRGSSRCSTWHWPMVISPWRRRRTTTTSGVRSLRSSHWWRSTWTPLMGTPPDQDYPSGHSIQGGVGAEVLKQVFGSDQISFKDCNGAGLPDGSTCYGATPVTRSYTSFTQAADENGYSRVLVGFHFHNATDVGTAYGRKIGERAAGMLPPIK